MTSRQVIHDGPGGPFESTFVHEEGAAGLRPGILLLPNIMGLKGWDVEQAERMAELGHAVLAADIFGQGKRPTLENPSVYMDVLRADRLLLRDRLNAALTALKSQPEVDERRLVAIGYCFGGQCAIDMVRSGAELRGAVSFHGVLDAPDYPMTQPATAKLLVLHGWDDPVAQPQAVLDLAREMTDAGVDWQIQAYGQTGHSFTNPATIMSRPGFGYVERADRRSWVAMQNFLAEVLS